MPIFEIIDQGGKIMRYPCGYCLFWPVGMIDGSWGVESSRAEESSDLRRAVKKRLQEVKKHIFLFFPGNGSRNPVQFRRGDFAVFDPANKGFQCPCDGSRVQRIHEQSRQLGRLNTGHTRKVGHGHGKSRGDGLKQAVGYGEPVIICLSEIKDARKVGVLQKRHDFKRVPCPREMASACDAKAFGNGPVPFISPSHEGDVNALGKRGESLQKLFHRLARFPMADNDDENVFSLPREFSIERQNSGRTLTFGAGAHRCVAAALARMEVKIAAQEMIRRFDNIKLAVPVEELTYLPTVEPRTLERVPVIFTKRSR